VVSGGGRQAGSRWQFVTALARSRARRRDCRPTPRRCDRASAGRANSRAGSRAPGAVPQGRGALGRCAAVDSRAARGRDRAVLRRRLPFAGSRAAPLAVTAGARRTPARVRRPGRATACRRPPPVRLFRLRARPGCRRAPSPSYADQQSHPSRCAATLSPAHAPAARAAHSVSRRTRLRRDRRGRSTRVWLRSPPAALEARDSAWPPPLARPRPRGSSSRSPPRLRPREPTAPLAPLRGSARSNRVRCRDRLPDTRAWQV
jgi:hypothetical protein